MPTRFDELVLDSVDPHRTGRWWADALGWRFRVTRPDEAVIVPPDGAPGLPIVVGAVPEPPAPGHRLHLDLASRTRQEQQDIVLRLEQGGARRVDVGQGDVPWVVLADPDGFPFCVLEPRPEYADSGALAAVVLHAQDVIGQASFWAAALGWGIVTSGPGFAGLRPPGMSVGPAFEVVETADPKPPGVKNRLHVDVAPRAGAAMRDAEVARLVGLGATHVDVGQHEGDGVPWVVLADPEGNELCVLPGS